MGENIHKTTHTRGANPKNDTDGGMTRNQRAQVLAWEKKHENDKYESVAVVDKNGKLIESSSGMTDRVHVPGTPKQREGAIITHNHPGAVIKRQTSLKAIARRIGNMHSEADIRVAVVSDAQGIRVKTGGYIFSLERGKKGWNGADSTGLDDRIQNQLDKLYEIARKKGYSSADWYHRTHIAIRHQELKKFAQKYGLKYTRRKG